MTKLAISQKEAMEMMSCGKDTADKIGREAKAIIKIGKKKLYNVAKLQVYLDKLSEGDVE